MISNYTTKNGDHQIRHFELISKVSKGIFMFLLTFCSAMSIQAQETFTSVKSGNYSDLATWGTTELPTAADDIVISTGNTITLDGDYTANNVIIDGKIEASSSSNEYTVKGDLVLSTSGLFIGNFYLDFGTYGYYKGMKLTVSGSILNDGRIDLSIGSNYGTEGTLKLNGTTPQTISGTGRFGGIITAIDNSNTRSVINQLEINNTSTDTPNIVWDFDNIRIKSVLTLTNARVDLISNKMIIGNYDSATTNVTTGSGFLSGTIGKWYRTSENYAPLIPGTNYNNSKTLFPFINADGKSRSAYITRPSDPQSQEVAGELSVSYTDATTVTSGLSINDNGYTVTNVYDGVWTVSKDDKYAFPLGNHSLAINLEDAYIIKNGNSRIIKYNGTTVGTFQDGTNTPFAQRISLTDADLNNTFEVGYNAALDTPVTSIASGNWGDASTWSTNAVPTCSEVVTILSGFTVTVNSVGSAQGLNISSGGTLISKSGSLTVGCTNNNAIFSNTGTFTLEGGSIVVNGSVAHNSGSNFNQSGGDLIVDGNHNGDAATSSKLTLFQISSANLNLTAGKITIVDPPVVSSTLATTHSLTQIIPCTGFFCWNGPSIVLDSVDNLVVGQVIVGEGVPPGTKISEINTEQGSIYTTPYLPLTGLNLPLTLSFYNLGNTGSAFIYDSETNYAAGTEHTLQIGDGVSTEKSAVTVDGYNCNLRFGDGTLSLNNLIVNAPDPANRFVNFDDYNPDYNQVILNVQNDFTITKGKVITSYIKTYYGGNVINNGALFGNDRMYFGNFIEDNFEPTSKPQTISGSGMFNAQADLALNNDENTGSVGQLEVNNTSPEGVTFMVPFTSLNGLRMTAGIIHTTESSLLSVGAPSMGISVSIDGNFGETCYIDGPVAKVIGGGQKAIDVTSEYNQKFFFPVGKTSYTPIWVGVTTPAGDFGSPGTNLKVQAFDTNPGTASANIAHLSQNRWEVSQIAGTIIDFNIKVGDSEIKENNILVQAPAANGMYDNDFGITATFVEGEPNTLASNTAPLPFSNFEGYFSTARQSECSVVTPGNTIASKTTICNGVPITLSLENVVVGEGITYQWQYSTTDANYLDITDATGTTVVVSPLENTYYRCNVSCSFSSSTVASTPVMISLNNTITETTPGKICDAETTATIYAVSTETVKWYDMQVGGNTLGTGNSFTTPEITETTTYFAGTETTSSATAGLVNTNDGYGSGGTNKGLAFNLTNSIILNSVKVYPVQTPEKNAAAPITIGVFQNGVQVPGTASVVFTPIKFESWGAPTTAQVVPLNFALAPGDNYTLQTIEGITYENALGVTNPDSSVYPITNGAVSIIGTFANDFVEAYGYNFFYDWDVTEVCSSARVPVLVTYQTDCGLSTVANSKVLEKIFAYPNPYNNTFKLDLATISNSDVTVKVYDMMGRLLESNEISVQKSSGFEIGANYPSGIYNVVVTQENASKTLRVIKQ